MQDHGGYGDYGSIEGFESEKFEKKKSENFFLFHLKWFIRIMGKSKALFLRASIRYRYRLSLVNEKSDIFINLIEKLLHEKNLKIEHFFKST